MAVALFSDVSDDIRGNGIALIRRNYIQEKRQSIRGLASCGVLSRLGIEIALIKGFPASQIIDPPLDAAVVFLHDPPVPVIEINIPDDEEIAVDWVSGQVTPPEGSGVGNCTRAYILGVPNVPQPFRIEPDQIEVIDRRFRPGGHIVQPSHALVPLRAIGRQAVQVIGLCPDNDLLDLIDQLARAVEPAARCDSRSNHPPFKAAQVRLAGKSGYFYITEAIVGKPGLIDFTAPAFENVNIHGLGVSKIVLVDRAVLAQGFGEPQYHFRVAGALHV